jgi:putative nucleotidyltransferase-like protein
MNASRPRPNSPVERQLRSLLASLPQDPDAFRLGCLGVHDWGALFSMAAEHGVAGVVLEATQNFGIDTGSLASEIRAGVVRPSMLWREVLDDTLRAILTALAERSIPAAALKGPVFAARLYSDEAARSSSDLDLLVDPSSLDAAIDALRPLGYELEGGESGRFFRYQHYHVHMLHPTLPTVELHFEAYRGFGTALPAAPLLARSMHCHLSGWENARVLAPEDEFLYLAVHAASHRFQRLVWLYDLKLLALRHPHLRWDLLATAAREHRLLAVVSFACSLLSDWLGMPRLGYPFLSAPAETRSRVAQRLAPPQSLHFTNAAADFLFCAWLCDDVVRVGAFAARFARIKLLHEVPLRVKALLSA